MLRFISRFLGFWLAAAAIVAAVVDGAKSIADSTLVTTSLAETWAMIAAAVGLEPFSAEQSAVPWPLNLPLEGLLASPTVVILGALGVAFLVLGAKKRPPSLSREFAA